MYSVQLSMPGHELADQYTLFFDDYAIACVSNGCLSASDSANFVCFDYIHGIPLVSKETQVPDFHFHSVACGDDHNLVVLSNDATKTPASYPHVLPTLLLVFLSTFVFVKVVFRRLI